MTTGFRRQSDPKVGQAMRSAAVPQQVGRKLAPAAIVEATRSPEAAADAEEDTRFRTVRPPR